eukprot:4776282-Prymnesium_polylepis.1
MSQLACVPPGPPQPSGHASRSCVGWPGTESRPRRRFRTQIAGENRGTAIAGGENTHCSFPKGPRCRLGLPSLQRR